MNKKVFIYQDGTIPGHRIIEELEKRGRNALRYTGKKVGHCYTIGNNIIRRFSIEGLEDFTKLFYDKETDSFYEKTDCSGCTNDKGCINCQDGDMKETHWGEEAPSAQEAAKSMRMQAWEVKDAMWPDVERLQPFTPQIASTEVAINNMLKGLKENSATLSIPEGYEANIEDGKVIVRKKDVKPLFKMGDWITIKE